MSEHQAWISLFMAGSRGWSHEQVRHGSETGISQRSTRFVDETNTAYLPHPLILDFIENGGEESYGIDDLIRLSEERDKAVYINLVDRLQRYMIRKGITDKTAARKQGRGAARGYLGNALATEMIFSASVWEWQEMLRQRCSDGADAEIRLLFNQALPVLQASRFGRFFIHYKTQPAKDGLGYVIA
jgi:thymidylate synthase ThyX